MAPETCRTKCRVCLGTNLTKLFDWRTSVIESYENLSFAECFHQCTGLDDALDLPQMLCFDCAGELVATHKFIRKAKETDQTLRRSLQLHASTKQGNDEPKFECIGVEEDLATHECSKRAKLHSTVQNEINLDVGKEHEPKQEPFEFQACDAPVDIRPKKSSKKSPTTGTASIKRSTGVDVTCEYCSQTFAENKLRNHIARAHKTETFLCHACPRTFKYKKALHVHTLTHDDNRERNFTCEHCGRKFFTQTTFHNHAKTHETDRKPIYQCAECDKSFFHKGSLTLHMHIHTGKTISCKICEKSFIRQIDLDIHLRSHSGDKPYQCEQCGKSFVQVGILNKHIRHHEGYRYKCNLCDKEYTHQSTLLSHKKEHTGMPLKCALCDKGFVKKSKMRRHISGVHKLTTVEEIDNHIIKVKTKREYRGRIIETI